MTIQVPRKGNPGRDKQCWKGIPGSQNVLTSASATGSVVSVLSTGASGGVWTYELTETSLYFEIVGDELRTSDALPVGVYHIQVKMTKGAFVAYRKYVVRVRV
jgi:hypothetical protein